MIRILCRAIGGIFCLLGLIGMLTPIPLGVFFFVIGLLFLIPSTPSAARSVRWVRGKVGVFDRVMQAVTNKLPLPYKRILRQTEPGGYDW